MLLVQQVLMVPTAVMDLKVKRVPQVRLVLQDLTALTEVMELTGIKAKKVRRAQLVLLDLQGHKETQ